MRGAYRHLVPPLSRPVRLSPRMQPSKEAHDAGPCIGLETGTSERGAIEREIQKGKARR